MRWSYLGRIEYQRALSLQERLRAGVLEGRTSETLLLLEHPPVITLGRSADARSNVLVSDERRRAMGVELCRVGRGGDVTYHGPGQLVGYPIRRVDRAVRPHVEGMARAISDVLGELGIESWWTDDRPGVWTPGGKIAAVGVDARGGVAIHGFALNVATDLSAFRMIVPCGLQAPVTSVSALLGEGATPGLGDMARRMARSLCARYGVAAEEVHARAIDPEAET